MERPLEHGLLTTYVNRRCHCASCTGAAREYGRRRARLRAYGRLEELVPLETVATHIKWLAAQGLGSRQIAHLANVSRPTVDEITSPSGPRRGVTPRVASAILAVLPGLDSCADNALVPAAGTQRRLQALMVLGWPLAEIQRATAAAALHKCMTRAQVTARLARAVRDFYDTNWDRDPATRPHIPAASITRTQSRAARAGWLPPLAWDDDTIDDPSSTPDPGALRPTGAGVRVYLEDVEFLAHQGATWEEIEARTGACRNSIEISCGRADRRDLVARITSNRRVAA